MVISLVTLGSPDQVTGGYLYHRRLADAAAAHDARVDFVDIRTAHNPLRRRADVVLVDSIAAARAAPWQWIRPAAAPLAAILHQPPGGIDRAGVVGWFQARLDRALYRRCRVLIAASVALRDELVSDHDLPGERIVVIPPGCDVAPIPDEPVDLRRGRRVAVLNVGNWVARKGTLELLDAFATVPGDLATLHLAGRDDVERRYAGQVYDRLADPRLADRVIVHGQVDRIAIARLYHGADLFVLPSTREPYGTVYGEALAAGLPVVGWRAGNLPYLVDDGVQGIVLEPHDVAGLSAAIARLASDDSLRARMATAARHRGSGLPSWHETTAKVFSELRGLISSQ